MREERDAKFRPVHQNLDTAYVNLAALLRYLQQREFAGRVHVELDEYEADVLFDATGRPRARETDHATGRQAEGEDALQRLLVRASEPGGLVSVYQKEVEDAGGEEPSGAESDSEDGTAEGAAAASDEEREWDELVSLSGEVIATIERAALSAGADFKSIFRSVRLGMADDYAFLDPSLGRFEYQHGRVRLRVQPGVSAYVSSISEAMRRVVNAIATGPRRASLRERVALELAVLARRRQSQLAKFKFTPQLDRIAGTRVL
ncbi:MAG TPA: hypothetical protein VF791_09875 [Pyrinomonadaceae bacterium]